jgi:hypothetical protein
MDVSGRTHSLARLMLAMRTEIVEAWPGLKLEENDATPLSHRTICVCKCRHRRVTSVDIYLKVKRTNFCGESGIAVIAVRVFVRRRRLTVAWSRKSCGIGRV